MTNANSSSWLAQSWKAVLGFFVPGLTLLVAGWLDGSLNNDHLTMRELLTALVTAVVTSLAVWLKRNGASTDPTTSTPMPFAATPPPTGAR